MAPTVPVFNSMTKQPGGKAGSLVISKEQTDWRSVTLLAILHIHPAAMRTNPISNSAWYSRGFDVRPLSIASL